MDKIRYTDSRERWRRNEVQKIENPESPYLGPGSLSLREGNLDLLSFSDLERIHNLFSSLDLIQQRGQKQFTSQAIIERANSVPGFRGKFVNEGRIKITEIGSPDFSVEGAPNLFGSAYGRYRKIMKNKKK